MKQYTEVEAPPGLRTHGASRLQRVYATLCVFIIPHWGYLGNFPALTLHAHLFEGVQAHRRTVAVRNWASYGWLARAGLLSLLPSRACGQPVTAQTFELPIEFVSASQRTSTSKALPTVMTDWVGQSRGTRQ